MKEVLGRMFTLVYAAVMGLVLYLNIPRALLFADGKAAFWVLAATILCLLAAACLISLPPRGLLHWSGKSCGKFFAVCCAALIGGPVTYELYHYLSAGLFSGEVVGGVYVLFGGICMMACPIVAIYRYVS